ncbi:MAG: hypothetical protein RJA07_1834 [Bacteroidota bacterium]|jgi:sterol desaturase/sphingolipid hydroxylase (fatty acid hydroxylase superfamily)
MNSIVNYFSNVPDSHRIYLLTAALFLFGYIETLFSFKSTDNKLKHILTNALFMLPAAPVQIALGLLLLSDLRFTSLHHFGILNWLPLHLNNFGVLLLGFVLLDLGEYAYHITMHKVKRLWMCHLVHHSDLDLTVSTTLREHPFETGIRLLFLIVWVFFSGIPFWALLFRLFFQIASNVFVHANFRINERVDKVVSILFVTPNMHQVHHHFQQPHTDKNYGDVLSIWDRMFGTFTTATASELVFGVDTYFDKKENANFIQLLKVPFGKYRQSKNY